MLTCHPQCPGLGFWVPLSTKRNQGSLGKGVLPGLGQGKYKRSLLRQAHNGRKWGGAREKMGLDRTVAEASLRKSQPWDTETGGREGWGGTDVCVRSAFLPTTRWPITEGRSLGRNQVDSLYQRFTVNTTDPCCDAENTASLFVAVLPKMHNLEQEKTTDKSKWGNIPQSNRPTLCKVASPWHERTGELSMSQVTKVTRLQNAVGSPGLDPRPEKKDVREKNEWSSTRMGIG